MRSQRRRVLLICHASAAESAAAVAHALQRAPAKASSTDILCYGRASTTLPTPAGTRLVGLPTNIRRDPWTALSALLGLVGRRYDLVALAQPSLGTSRARGALIAFTFAIGRRRAVIVDPVAQRAVRRITLRLAMADLLRWASWQAIGVFAGTALSSLIRRLSNSESDPVRGKGGSISSQRVGEVAYLRTDLELKIAPLVAGGSVAHTEGILVALLDREYAVGYWGTGAVDGIPTEVRRYCLPALARGNVPTEFAELVSGCAQGYRLSRRSSNAVGLVYQRYSLNNVAGVILSRCRRVPLVLEANGSEAKWRQDFSTLKYPKLAFACERLILRRAAVIAAVSNNAAEDLIAAGAPPERVRVVPNGVTVARFAEAKPPPLPETLIGGFVVCFVGLFYPWHGVRFLAEAFSLFHQHHRDARLLLVGDGEEAPAVRAVLERRGARNAAHFTGLVPRSEAPRYMAAADVLVLPHANVHRFIGSPIKLFEYMAAGRPIVATRVGQIEEILVDGRTALLVPPEDAEAMATALARVRDDRALGSRLGQAAQREAIDHHSWDSRLAAILHDNG